jgi:hypothetical protein
MYPVHLNILYLLSRGCFFEKLIIFPKTTPKFGGRREKKSFFLSSHTLLSRYNIF